MLFNDLCMERRDGLQQDGDSAVWNLVARKSELI